MRHPGYLTSALAERTILGVLESALEDVFRAVVRRAGAQTIKLAPIVAGTPDRLVLWPGGKFELVELKTEIGTLAPIQRVWIERAAAIGHEVTVLRGADAVRSWASARDG